MPRKSKGLFEAIDDLVYRRRKGQPEPKPEPIPTSRTPPTMEYLQKKQPLQSNAQKLQAKLNKIGRPKRVRKAKINKR